VSLLIETHSLLIVCGTSQSVWNSHAMKTDRSIYVHPVRKDKQTVKKAAVGMWIEVTCCNRLQASTLRSTAVWSAGEGATGLKWSVSIERYLNCIFQGGHGVHWSSVYYYYYYSLSTLCRVFNPLNAELKPICHLLALLGAHHILHVSRIRVNNKTNQMHQFHKFILAWNSTCFGQFLCPSSGVYSLYTRQWYTSCRFEDSFRAGACKG